MRRIFYYCNVHGALIFEYRDNGGQFIDRCYIDYTLREALHRFRIRTAKDEQDYRGGFNYHTTLENLPSKAAELLNDLPF